MNTMFSRQRYTLSMTAEEFQRHFAADHERLTQYLFATGSLSAREVVAWTTIITEATRQLCVLVNSLAALGRSEQPNQPRD